MIRRRIVDASVTPLIHSFSASLSCLDSLKSLPMLKQSFAHLRCGLTKLKSQLVAPYCFVMYHSLIGCVKCSVSKVLHVKLQFHV